MGKPKKKQSNFKAATAACAGSFTVLGLLMLLGGQSEEPPAATFVSDVLQSETREVPDVVGMYERMILVNNNGATVWFTLASSLQCEYGDYDVLKGEALPGHENEKRILVTVEALDSNNDFPGVYAEVRTDDFLQNRQLSFTVPYSETPQHYGVYVCTAPQDLSSPLQDLLYSCRSKPVADFAGKYVESSPTYDVFFFSYFTVFRDRVQIMGNQVSEFQKGQIAAHLGNNLGATAQQTEGVLQSLKVLNRYEPIRTGTLKPVGARFEINLPRMDDISNCANVNRRTFGIDEVAPTKLPHHNAVTAPVDSKLAEFARSWRETGSPDMELAEELLAKGYFSSREEMQEMLRAGPPPPLQSPLQNPPQHQGGNTKFGSGSANIR